MSALLTATADSGFDEVVELPLEWQVRVVESLSAAEELLDWLDARGITEREFNILGNAEFEVRWQ